MPSKSAWWPWRPFVYLSMTMALLPGFALGGLMLTAVSLGWDTSWYAAARQAHGHAQLMGWGGAMFFGVGLHFLPRLRGAKLVVPHVIPWLFTLFASGLVMRTVAQPLAALTTTAFATWRGLMVAGTVAETIGILGVLAVLAVTLRLGPPLKGKKGFAQTVPLLVVAAGGLIVALAGWGLSSLSIPTDPAGNQAAAAVLTDRLQPLATWAALFGFVPALSLAMSTRIFPLFFRIRAAWAKVVPVAAVLVGLGIVGLAGAALQPRLIGAAFLCLALGLLVGIYATQVFAPRLAFPGDKGNYRILAEPAAVGVLTAYLWAVVGAVTLIGQGLWRLGLPTAFFVPSLDLAIHSFGAGFMTLLIISVGSMLIPAFAGVRPAGHHWLWAALAAGNAAALLRTAFIHSPPAWSTGAMAVAGLLGMAAVLGLAAALWAGRQAAATARVK